MVFEGALMLIVGEELSTMNGVLGPAAGALLPAGSPAVPAPMEIPSVPPPVIALMVTVYRVPAPLTLTVPLAVPVLLSVMFAGVRALVIMLASEKVTVKLTSPPLVLETDGALIVTTGARLSTRNAALTPDAGAL